MTEDSHPAAGRQRRGTGSVPDALPAFLATLLVEESDDRPVPALGLGDQEAAVELLAATRAVLLAHEENEVVTAVARFCLAMGGRLVPAARDPGTALPLDLALGTGTPVLADADPLSIARMRLEQFLPSLVEDARTALARLRQLDEANLASSTDPLTGLLSRRELMRRLATATVGDVVAFLDIAHVGEVDDRDGHMQGDVALAELGRILRAELRGAHEAGRYGCDEILVVFRGMSEQLAVQRLRRLQDLWPDSDQAPAAFSVGTAAVGQGGVPGALERANAALHAAKGSGRDRCRGQGGGQA